MDQRILRSLTLFIPFSSSYNGNTPLILASREGHDETVELLLKKGADRSVKNHEHKTALDVAASREIKALLKRTPAAATLPPPPELEAWFAALQLSEHCARVCGDHRLRFVADCSVLDEDDLKASDVTSKVERRRFLAAAAAQR